MLFSTDIEVVPVPETARFARYAAVCALAFAVGVGWARPASLSSWLGKAAQTEAAAAPSPPPIAPAPEAIRFSFVAPRRAAPPLAAALVARAPARGPARNAPPVHAPAVARR